ncbi:hypothetical protein G1K66_12140 [Tenacibaculum finnmarkense]|uniref:hypothetical protein n=1 Tax=Tenacibaculum finnmarkense TaxID=2781243 RepID=UPI001EFAD158|nr:hypothetical protein [Tenacibaculum finnmarkense]MCG8814005.1 hypothetical protein [Tenacibaculum finnmarkense]
MKKIDKFIEEINLILNQLNSLENEFIESYEDFIGYEFDGQDKCVSEIENLTLMLTHELSTQIGFGIQDLKTLIKYIDFRKKYKDYSDEELSNLIDNINILNIKQKREIKAEKKEKDTGKIISEWNATFENNSYEKLKEKLRLKTPYNTVYKK